MDTLAWRLSWSCQALAAREVLPPEALKGFFFFELSHPATQGSPTAELLRKMPSFISLTSPTLPWMLWPISRCVTAQGQLTQLSRPFWSVWSGHTEGKEQSATPWVLVFHIFPAKYLPREPQPPYLVQVMCMAAPALIITGESTEAGRVRERLEWLHPTMLLWSLPLCQRGSLE